MHWFEVLTFIGVWSVLLVAGALVLDHVEAKKKPGAGTPGRDR